MNRYCESLMGSFSQTSNESWFPRHDGINDQLRVCVRRGFPVIHTQARNCSLATGEPLLWISVSHLTDGFPPGCDALCSPSFYFSTKLSLNGALLFCPFLCINERISSQICVWINGSMVESTWVNILMVSPRNQDLPLILVFPLWRCVWWRLCFVLLFATNFCLCYFTPLFNYESWSSPSCTPA